MTRGCRKITKRTGRYEHESFSCNPKFYHTQSNSWGEGMRTCGRLGQRFRSWELSVSARERDSPHCFRRRVSLVPALLAPSGLAILKQRHVLQYSYSVTNSISVPMTDIESEISRRGKLWVSTLRSVDHRPFEQPVCHCAAAAAHVHYYPKDSKLLFSLSMQVPTTIGKSHPITD